MKTIIRPFLFLLFLFTIYNSQFTCSAVYADIHVSSSCSQADVQAAINAASDGDTVMVPVGISTWTTTVSGHAAVEITGKGITLKGAGAGQTIIQDGTTSGNKEGFFDFINGDGKSFRITGFTFDGTNNTDSNAQIIRTDAKYINWRIDHCKFLNINDLGVIYLNNVGFPGLIDNCTFYCEDQVGYNFIFYYGITSDWAKPLAIGTSNAVYVENNYIEYPVNGGANGHNDPANKPSLAVGGGDRWVYRHNTVVNSYIETNGYCYTGLYARGTIFGEVYDNNFTGSAFIGISAFGGSEVIFNNTMTGSFGNPPYRIDNLRSNSTCGNCGLCDGSNPLDGNLALESGAHNEGINQPVMTCTGKNWALNQWTSYYIYNLADGSKGKVSANTSNTITAILSGGTNNLWNPGDNFKLTNGYPCLDQVGYVMDASPYVKQPQSVQPLYAWSNTYNGSTANMQVKTYTSPTLSQQIVAGRDFYNCSSKTDAESKGLIYTPLAYPHPLALQDLVDTSSPTAPGYLYDGTGADVGFTYSTTTLSANWSASSDPESGISGYQYTIGTTPEASNIISWTTLGNVLTVVKSGIDLTGGTTYYFSVRAINGVGLIGPVTNSNGQVIMPPAPPNLSSPVISGVSAQNITATGATIIWATDENSTSQVEYGRTVNYGSLTIEDASLHMTHSSILSDLIPGSVYHYSVISLDGSGNEAASGDYTFTTPSVNGPVNPEVHAYPNPVKITDSRPMKFRISGMTSGSVEIYTVSGRFIKKQTGATEISWDGKNTDGEKAQRGIYIYKITSASGDSVTGKLVLTK